MNNTDAFMDRFAIVKKWFESEETEISDLSLGRMASRLGEYEKSVRAAALQEVREKVEGMKRVKKPTHGTCCTCQTCGYANDDGADCECIRNKIISDLQAWIDEQLVTKVNRLK